MAKNPSRCRVLIFSKDTCYRTEADDLNALASLTSDNIHLYKPRASFNDVRQLLEQLPDDTLSKIVLHHHRELAKSYGVKGIHRRYREIDTDIQSQTIISSSLKSLNDSPPTNTDYCFFSPVFSSLSKQNHHPKYTIDQINAWAKTQTQPMIALGGVDLDNIHLLHGFSGAAFKGAIWNTPNPRQKVSELLKGVWHES
ncbi:MAG: thiamine phosphate synthase [Cellvibrionales bacterium]|nr:thiamine phosphate synthase [Cellvibrionales bacterium]